MRVAHSHIRAHVPHLARDRYLAQDIDIAEAMILDGSLLGAVEADIGILTAF